MNAKLYEVEGPWRGKLAVVPRPRGGDWLSDEAEAWRRAGVDVVVSLLTSEEVQELDLGREADACGEHGIACLNHPIQDRDVPTSLRSMAELVFRLEEDLAAGRKVAVHCRQGVGRSAVLAACLLVAAGVAVGDAFARVAEARGCPVPDTVEQRAWVARFASQLAAPRS